MLTVEFTRSNQDCAPYRDIWYSTVVPTFDPDVIVLASRATDHLVGSDYAVESTDQTLPTDQSLLLPIVADESIDVLQRPGRDIVVIEPVPVSRAHAMSCLSAATMSTECTFETEAVSTAERGYRGLVNDHPGLHTLDIDALVCPRLPICDPVLDGILVRKDHDHITAAWSAHMADRLLALLQGIDAL